MFSTVPPFCRPPTLRRHPAVSRYSVWFGRRCLIFPCVRHAHQSYLVYISECAISRLLLRYLYTQEGRSSCVCASILDSSSEATQDSRNYSPARFASSQNSLRSARRVGCLAAVKHTALSTHALRVRCTRAHELLRSLINATRTARV